MLPLLAGQNNSTPYFYEKSASYNLSFIGLNEAVEAHTGQRMDKDKMAVEFGLRILQEMAKLARTASEENQLRISVSQRPGDEAAARLAKLDMEQYGRAVMVADGTRGLLHYTDMPTLSLTAKIPVENRISLESKFQAATPGGHLNVLSMSGTPSVNVLVKLIETAFDSGSKFLTFTSNYSTCEACNLTETGLIPKCSHCGSSKLTYTGRPSFGLLPFSLWSEAKRRNAERRVSYSLTG